MKQISTKNVIRVNKSLTGDQKAMNIQDMRFSISPKQSLKTPNSIKKQTIKINNNDNSNNLNISIDNINNKPEPKKPKFRILIVDDDSIIRKSLIKYVNKYSEDMNMSVDIKEADNSVSCLNLIYNYFTQNKFFDIIIIDEIMPLVKGSLIIELLKNLYNEENFKKPYIMSYTILDNPNMKEAILAKGADCIVTKPIQYKTFIDIIEGVISKKIK